MRTRSLFLRPRLSVNRIPVVAVSLVLLSIAAFAGQTPASAASAQGPVTPSCAWAPSSVSNANAGEPDSSVTYYGLLWTVQNGLQITLDGRYPDSRYISMDVYTSAGALFSTNGVASSLTDYDIQPDPGSVNPWQHTVGYAGRAGDAFTVNLQSDVAPGQVNTLPLAPAGTAPGTIGGVSYRVYLPADGNFSRVPLPTVTFTLNGVSKQVPPCPAGTPTLPSPAAATPSAESATAPAAVTQTFPFRRLVPGSGDGEPNADAAYLYAGIEPSGDDDVVVIRGKAPTAARGDHPSPWPAPGIDMQYWSLCDYLSAAPEPLVANQLPDGSIDYGCRYDSQVAHDRQGYYTFVVGTEAQRAAIERIPGVTFLPFSTAQPTALHILELRNMVVNTSFAEAVQDIPQDGTPATAADVMGPYYPEMAACSLATLTSGGVTACQAASATAAG
jgi:hypothetical protein